VVPPAAERRDEWRIRSDIAEAAGLPWMGSRVADTVVRGPARLPLVGRYLTITHDRLVELMTFATGAPAALMARRWPHGRRLRANKVGEWLGSKRVPTDDHKVHLAPTAFVESMRTLEAPGTGPAAHTSDRDAGAHTSDRDAGQLVLIGRRERHSHNSWTHNAEVFVGGNRTRNRLLVHPDDAAARRITDGTLVEVSSATGTVAVEATVSDEVMAGVVSLPHGWGHQEAADLTVASATAGANSNVLSPDGPDSIDALSGMARLTGIPVEVRAGT
jgi:formate dehydrogenase